MLHKDALAVSKIYKIILTPLLQYNRLGTTDKYLLVVLRRGIIVTKVSLSVIILTVVVSSLFFVA